MLKKSIVIMISLVSFSFAININDAKELIKQKNENLKFLKEDIQISLKDEEASSIWKNPILGIGANDILISDFKARDKEAMQTQFITFSQTIPLGDSFDIKKNISKKQTLIYNYLLDDKKLMYNSLLSVYFSEYKIIQNKIVLLKKYKTNVQNKKKVLVQLFQNQNSKQEEIVNTQILYSSLELKEESLLLKLDLIKLKIEELTFTKISKIEHSLESKKKINLDINPLIENHPLILAYKIKIKKENEKIKLEQSKKYSQLKLSTGYYQRENFDDYLAFSISMPLSIYGSENIKILKNKKRFKKSKNSLNILKNQFMQDIKQLQFQKKNALNKYKILTNKMIKDDIFIGEILKSKSSILKFNSIKIIDNLNNILKKKLLALDELSKYYKANGKLKYYIGENL